MKQLLFAATLFFSFSLSARADWTKIDSTTTANLWGVCYGGNQYVAVGTAGTILTSPDGTKWTQRVSGTTEWLTAIASGNNLYVAVGDHGTILTSADGITWISRVSSGQRLNGIAYGDGRFLAVGEAGTVRTSTDAITWSTRTLPVNTWLRGVCYGMDDFIIGGNATLAATSDGLVFRYAGEMYAAFEALLYSEGVTWAAGSGASRTPALFVRGPLQATNHIVNYEGYDGVGTLRGIARVGEVIAAVGSSGRVVVLHLGSSNLYAESRLGSANLNSIASGQLGFVAVGDAGTVYAETISPSGLKPPSSAKIVARPDVLVKGRSTRLFATAVGSRPFTYKWFLNGQPISGATQDSLLIQNAAAPDTGTYSVAIKNPAGEATTEMVISLSNVTPSRIVDPTFVSGSAAVTLFGFDDLSTLTNDGAVYLRPINSIMKRLNANGSWDSAFSPPTFYNGPIAALPDGGLLAGNSQETIKLNANGATDPAFTPIKGSPVVLENGEILGVFLSDTDWGDGRPIIAELRRYHSDGTPDPGYPAKNLVLLAGGDLSHGPFAPTFSVAGHQRDSKGRTLVVASSSQHIGTGAFGSNQSRLFRLKPNGELDPEFSLVSIDECIVQIAEVAGKIYYRSARQYGPLGSMFETKVGRCNADGTIDGSYTPLVFTWGPSIYDRIPTALLLDGSVLVARSNRDAANIWKLQRYAPDGQLAEEVALQTDGMISRIIPLENGRIMISGSFTSVDGIFTAGLARLTLVTPTHDSSTYLANLSIRTTAGSGDQTLIAGFVVSGEGGTRSVMARGVGPGLVPLGINARDVVGDPQLKLFRGQASLAVNDDWAASLEPTANRLGAYPLVRDSKDAALFTSLQPGAYTAHITSTTNTSGIALIELYDADGPPTSASSPRLVNLAGRARVGTGDNALIAGFVLAGQNAKRLLVRAIGPGLGAHGVTDVLADPQLTIYRGADPIVTNDNWNSADQLVFKQVGAFGLTPGSKDAAVVADLVAGVHTVVVRGANNTIGTALVEIYEVP